MFENVILKYLNPVIETYMPHIDRKQFEMHLLKGEIRLENVQLKVDTLNSAMGIPVHIESVSIAKLYAGVNWKKLFSQAITVQVEGIRVVCRDKVEVPWDEKKLVEEINAMKLGQLKAIETSELSKEENGVITATNDGSGQMSVIAIMKLVFGAIKNLVLDIKDIHVSYVHYKGHGIREPSVVRDNEVECVVGLGMERLTLQDGDDMKVLRLQNTFVYCNTEPSQFHVPSQGRASTSIVPPASAIQQQLPHASQDTRIDHSIAQAQSAPVDLNVVKGEGAAQTIRPVVDNAPIVTLSVASILTEYINQFGFVLEPFTLDLGLKLGAHTSPTNVVSVRLHTDLSLDIKIYERQLKGLLRMLGHIGKVGARSTQVMESLQRTRFRCANKDEQQHYIDLYSRTLNADWLEDLSKDEQKEKDRLEKELSLADLTILRKAAMAQVAAAKGARGVNAKAEVAATQAHQGRSAAADKSPSVARRTAKKGWFASLFDWGSADDQEDAPVYVSRVEKQKILESVMKEYEDAQKEPVSPAQMGTEPKASTSSELVTAIPILPPASLPFHVHFELTLCIPKVSLALYTGSGVSSSVSSSTVLGSGAGTSTLSSGGRVVIKPSGSDAFVGPAGTQVGSAALPSQGRTSQTSSRRSSLKRETNDEQLIQMFLNGSHLCVSLMTYEQKCMVDFAVTSLEMHDTSDDLDMDPTVASDKELQALDRAYRQILLISPSAAASVPTDSPLADTASTTLVSGSSQSKPASSSRRTSQQLQKPIRITFTTPQKKSDNNASKNREGMNLLDIELNNVRIQFNPVLMRVSEMMGSAAKPSIAPASRDRPVGTARDADKVAAGLPGHKWLNIFDDIAFDEILSCPPGRTACTHLFPPSESIVTFLLSLASPVDLRLRMFHPLVQIMTKPSKVKAMQSSLKTDSSLLSVPAFMVEWSIKGDGEINRDRQYVGLNTCINNLQMFATTVTAENASLDHQKKLISEKDNHQHCLLEPLQMTFVYQQHEQTAAMAKKEQLDYVPTTAASGEFQKDPSALSGPVANVLNPPLAPVWKQLRLEMQPLNLRLTSSLADMMLQMMESGATENPVAQNAMKAGLTFLSTRGRI